MSAPSQKLMAVDVKTQGSMFEASVPHSLFDVTGYPFGAIGPVNTTGSYEPSADGQKFLASIRPTAQVSNPLTIVLNWAAGLKK